METTNLDPDQVKKLAKRYLDGIATEEEKKLLHDWYDTVNAGDTEMVMVSTPRTTAEFGNEMLAELTEMIAADKEQSKQSLRIHRFKWWRMAAAVFILMIATVGVYRILNRRPKDGVAEQPLINVKEVIAPQKSRAMITLSNGKILYLDSIGNGPLAIQGNTNLVKLSDGQLAYIGESGTPEMQYNVLTVPRGSKVMGLTLTDGTRVWLNAESSLRYPVAFAGKDRTVQITGEAYFEVMKDAHRKFYVKGEGVTTEVLGTHFNVNTYRDEEAMKVTLLEGSIKVTASNSKEPAIIKPGQQAQVTSSPVIHIMKDADLEAVMAWKNEQFMMKGTDLGTLTRQMARWYDIEIIFGGAMPDKKFGGSVSRNVNLKTILEALNENGIKNKIEGRTVTIE